MGLGYQALRETAAYLDLSARGKIFATGEDRVRLLHAMTTNHIQQLQPGQGCYAFFLNAQGRILADANIFLLTDRILLDIEPEIRERVYQHLDKYIIADDVTLDDASDSLTALGVEGPTAAEVMFEIGAPIPDLPYSHVDWEGRIVARVNATGEPGFRIFAPKEQMAALVGELATAGIPPAGAESARVVRLEHARPRYGEDIFDTTLPQETQQTHALSFNKGCYIGQEIVERIRSRGHVHRLLTGLRIEAAEPPAPKTKLLADGAEAGEITSAAFSPALRKVVALGYVRSQYAVPNVEFSAGGSSALTTPVAGSPEAAPAPTAGY
jgi:tRNA-modifying protein YgfZ